MVVKKDLTSAPGIRILIAQVELLFSCENALFSLQGNQSTEQLMRGRKNERSLPVSKIVESLL